MHVCDMCLSARCVSGCVCADVHVHMSVHSRWCVCAYAMLAHMLVLMCMRMCMCIEQHTKTCMS
jgi:hypothetical protein